MYPITEAVKALFEAEQNKVLRITGTDKNGTAISITDDDVLIDSFEIDRYSCNGQMLEIGTAISAQLSMKLENIDGRYDSIIFEGTELFVEVGIADWTQANPTITWVPCGYFTPDIQPRRMTTISITALDRMMWFENVKVLLHPWTTQSGEIIRDSAGEPIYFVSNASLVFPCTVAELVGRVCALCNVPFSQNLSGLPNYNYSIPELLVTDQSVTFRDVIKWCAGIMGTNAWIDWSGSLRFSWYNNDTGYVSTVDNRYNSDLYENVIVLTGVKCTLPDDESTMYIAGSNDYAIDLTGNNLINADNIQTILQNIYYVLNAFAYTPFSANVIAAPYLWPMDMMVFTDKDGNGHVSALTNVNLSLNGSTALSAVGESLKAYSYGTPGSFTLQQQAAMQKWRSNVVADTRAAVDNASAQITGAKGGYVRFMYDENGVMTEILIMNTPDIATATKVWRWNSGGFGYSSNGYQGPFTTAITQDGSIVANFITTGILNADLIQAGTMLADRIFGGTLTLGGSNNVSGTLTVNDANGNTIGTWNKDGITLNKGSIAGPSITLGGGNNADGSLTVKDANGNTIGILNKDGINIFKGDIQGSNVILTGGGSGAYGNYIEVDSIDGEQVVRIDFTGITIGGPGMAQYGGLQFLDATTGYNVAVARFIGVISSQYGYGVKLITSSSGPDKDTYLFYMNGAEFNADTVIKGNFTVSSGYTKSKVITTDQYADRLLYCYETPSPMYGDVGEAIIGDDGLCYVTIDPIFAQTITTDNYQVFLQRYGAGDCWVQERKGGWFVVAGTPGLDFGWEIKSKQADIADVGLRRFDSNDNFTVPTQTYGEDAAQHIIDIQKERIPA